MREFAIIWLLGLFIGLAALIRLSGRSWGKSIAVTLLAVVIFAGLAASRAWLGREFPVTGGEENPYCDGDDCPPAHPWEQ
jgi:hypothetical protein